MQNNFLDLIENNSESVGIETPFHKFEILLGEEAIKLLSNHDFLNNWDELYNYCPWSTVFQSKEYVVSWYKVYCTEYLPILVKAESEGKLSGLITLTKHTASGSYITAAGLAGAEYQTWLSTPALGEFFIVEALRRLRILFPSLDIHFYNTSPNTPLYWVYKSQHWQQRCTLKPMKRPLMDLRNPDISRLFRKKQFREKLNRLKRLGEVKFERVTDADLFASILDEQADQSDFRKGVRYNTTEFRNDPYKKQFLLNLYRKGILHTTTLKLDGQIIAFIAAATDGNWVHLAGINTHSPVFSKYSPGLINFIMLSQLLVEEGFSMFDLTPGEDAYKERLATSSDQVFNLLVSNKAKTYASRIIVEPILKIIKSNLIRNGLVPRKMKQEAKKIKSRIVLAMKNEIEWQMLWHYVWTGKAERLLMLKIFTINPELDVKEPIRVNNISELLDYNQHQGIQIQWDFLEDAMRRFEEGEKCYTLAQEGYLLFCAWHSTKSIDDTTGFIFPKNALVLQGLYCHTNAKNRLEEFLVSTASEILKANYSNTEIYCILNVMNKSLLQDLSRISRKLK